MNVTLVERAEIILLRNWQVRCVINSDWETQLIVLLYQS